MKVIKLKYFKFIEHSDKSRLTNTNVKNKELSIILNRSLADDNILFWNKKCLQTEYIYKNNEFQEKEVYNINYENVNKKQINTRILNIKNKYFNLNNCF